MQEPKSRQREIHKVKVGLQLHDYAAYMHVGGLFN